MTTVRINGRFNGPPGSANGGFACGMLARQLSGPVRVRLDEAIPLDTDLVVVPHDGVGVSLMHGDRRLAAATSAPAPAPPPRPPSIEAARTAGHRRSAEHPVETCFVCGPSRSDGLRLAPGPIGSDGRYATVWRPSRVLADRDGLIPEAFVWAALDCPSASPVLDVGGVALLGTLHGEVHMRPPAGHELIVSSWPVTRDGRKRRSGSAVHTATGELVASADAIWFAVDLEQFLNQGEP